MNGASSVTITADSSSGSWTFDYSSDPGPDPAADSFQVQMGKCERNPVSDPSTRRLVTVSMTNTADAGGRYIRTLAAEAIPDDRGLGYFSDKSYVTRLEDGETFTAELFERENGAPPGDSGLEAGTTWAIKVSRSDRRDTIWDQVPAPTGCSARRSVPTCRLTRVDRGCRTTRVDIHARDYWGADSTRRFRIRLVDARGRTVQRQALSMLTGASTTVVLTRPRTKKIPELVVEQWDPHTTYDTVGDGRPPSHWGGDYSDHPAWRSC